MGSIADGPTTIRNLEVPDRLYVEGTAEFTQGTTQDSVNTTLVFSNPGDDLDLVGHAGAVGTTGAIRIGVDTVGFYTDDVNPTAVLNTDRFNCDWVENDKNGLAASSMDYTPTTAVLTVDSATVTNYSANLIDHQVTVGAPQIWGNLSTLDISADNGDLGANHAGLRLGPTDVDIYDGTTDSPNPQASFAGSEAYMTQTVYAQMNSDAVADYGVGVWDWGVPPQANFHWAVTPGITVTATNVTIVRDGVYEITAGGHVGVIGGRIQIRLNGSTVIAQSGLTSIVNEYLQVTGTLKLVAGDYVEVVSETQAANEKNSFFKINKKMGTYDYIQDGVAEGRL